MEDISCEGTKNTVTITLRRQKSTVLGSGHKLSASDYALITKSGHWQLLDHGHIVP